MAVGRQGKGGVPAKKRLADRRAEGVVERLFDGVAGLHQQRPLVDLRHAGSLHLVDPLPVAFDLGLGLLPAARKAGVGGIEADGPGHGAVRVFDLIGLDAKVKDDLFRHGTPPPFSRPPRP